MGGCSIKAAYDGRFDEMLRNVKEEANVKY